MPPFSPTEALEYWLRRIVVPRDLYGSLTAKAKEHAFAVAGVAKLDLVQEIFDSLFAAMNSGTSLEGWQEAIVQQIGEQWGGKTPSRLENIFRTNLIDAHNAGRHAIMSDPDALEDRPYWRFDAIDDHRTTDICAQCDGVILPADHPWWRTHYPSLHYQCRSTVTPLTEAQAHREGVTASPPMVRAMAGFGAPPGGVPAVPAVKRQHDHDLIVAAGET